MMRSLKDEHRMEKATAETVVKIEKKQADIKGFEGF